MTSEEMTELFKKYGDSVSYNDFEKFEKIDKKSKRKDLHAFLLLDEILGDSCSDDMVSEAEHDQIYLGVDMELLAEKITEEQVKELVICGVFISEGYLSMFV
jgi:hypothetical protein